MNARVHLRIEGRVQGVFFRQSTLETARSLGLGGWVRNCRDGRVEALFEGEQRQVVKAVDWCRQGPPAAMVIRLTEEWQEFRGEFDDFRIVR